MALVVIEKESYRQSWDEVMPELLIQVLFSDPRQTFDGDCLSILKVVREKVDYNIYGKNGLKNINYNRHVLMALKGYPRIVVGGCQTCRELYDTPKGTEERLVRDDDGLADLDLMLPVCVIVGLICITIILKILLARDKGVSYVIGHELFGEYAVNPTHLLRILDVVEAHLLQGLLDVKVLIVILHKTAVVIILQDGVKLLLLVLLQIQRHHLFEIGDLRCVHGGSF
jgi:hypothetical protein